MSALRRSLLALSALLLVALAASPAAAGDDVRLRIGSPVHVAAGEVVDGDVVVIGADARVDGRVTGDVVVVGGRLTLGPDAEVEGSVVDIGAGAETVEAVGRIDAPAVPAPPVAPVAPVAPREPEAAVAPRASRDVLRHARPDRSFGSAVAAAGAGSWAVGTVFLLVLGLLFMSTWPERSRNLRRTVEAAPGTALLVGTLVAFGGFVLSLLLLATGVGILALPLVGAAFTAIWLTGVTGLCEAVGDRLPLPAAGRSRGGAFAAGCLALGAIGLLWLSGWFGGLIALLLGAGLGCAGIGASVLSSLGRQPYGSS